MPTQAEGSGGIPYTHLQPDMRKRLVVNTMLHLLYSWGRLSTHCTGGWMGLRAGLKSIENPAPTRI
jgi:hypothetical protein